MFANRITTKRLPFHAAVLALGLATTAVHAQFFTASLSRTAVVTAVPLNVKRTANPSKSVGNSYAGAKINFPIEISSEDGCRIVKVASKGSVTLLRKSATAAELEAAVKSCKNGTRTGTVKAKIAGFTVALDNKSASFTWEKKFTRTLISANLSVWVGPVPVTVRGSAAGALSAKLVLRITSSDAGISGPLGFSMKGTASGSVGVPGYSVGLSATLELLKSTLSTSLKSASSLSGSVQLCFEPMIIKLYLKVKAWPFSWSKTLAKYSLAKTCSTVLSL